MDLKPLMRHARYAASHGPTQQTRGERLATQNTMQTRGERLATEIVEEE